MLKDLLRSWHKKREKKLNVGGGGLHWPGPPQLLVYRSQWKFIFPIGHISFRKGLDSMLKLIWNYINPIGFAVLTRLTHPSAVRGDEGGLRGLFDGIVFLLYYLNVSLYLYFLKVYFINHNKCNDYYQIYVYAYTYSFSSLAEIQ